MSTFTRGLIFGLLLAAGLAAVELPLGYACVVWFFTAMGMALCFARRPPSDWLRVVSSKSRDTSGMVVPSIVVPGIA